MHYIKSELRVLRFGVENTNAVVRELYFELYAYKWGLSVSPSVAEMKQILEFNHAGRIYKVSQRSMVSIFRPAAVDFENRFKTVFETKFFSTIDIADKVQLDFWRTPLLL
jgi:hypothetical protein